MNRGRLVIVMPDAVERLGSDQYRLATKTSSGLSEYARTWPGEVVALARDGGRIPASMGTVHRAGDRGFELVVTDAPMSSHAVLRSAEAVLALHDVNNAELLARAPRRTILTVENSIVQRIRLGISGGAPTPLTKARVAAGWARRAPLARSMIRTAGGIQANGYPAWRAYAALSPQPMIFFDHRVSRALLGQAETRKSRRSASGLRLCFSGRHVPAKGLLFAVDSAARAMRSGADVTLDVFGSGEQTEAAQQAAAGLADRILFHGDVDFDSDWFPFVRDNVDAMLLPHVQGDPAGTYLEGAGAGAPTLGFANSALKPLAARHGLGWVVPVRDVASLAGTIIRLSRDQDAVDRARTRARKFVSAHTFEDEYSRRVRHIRDVVQW